MSDPSAPVPSLLAATGAGQQVAQRGMALDPPPDPPKGGAPTATTTIEGMVTLTIASHKFTLAGTLAKSAVIVEYHADFADSITLGTIKEITIELGQIFGLDNLQADIDAALDQIRSLPNAVNLANQLLNASVRITDLVINTATNTYGFGMALDFTADPPTLFDIKLDSIGFKVTRSKPPTAPTTPV
jgi:hypothetical protein